MMLEMMKELFGITHIRDNEEEVPNAKHMRIVEEEVSLSQPITVVVPQEEEVPLEEEEYLAPTVVVLQAPPPVAVPPEEEEVPSAPLVAVPPEGRGCLVPVPTLVSFSPFFSKMQEILLAIFLINVVDL
jgi:hypothetical protein